MVFGYGGLYANDINKIGDGQKNAFVSTSRLVWRKMRDDGYLIHLGGAFSFRTKEVNTDGPVTGIIDSEGVTSMFPAAMLQAEITGMGTETNVQKERPTSLMAGISKADSC